MRRRARRRSASRSGLEASVGADIAANLSAGTFDVFHVGHLRVLERAAAFGDRLVVGVSADALNLRKKDRLPVFSEAERLEIVHALRCVDEVFVEESLEQKRE